METWLIITISLLSILIIGAGGAYYYYGYCQNPMPEWMERTLESIKALVGLEDEDDIERLDAEAEQMKARALREYARQDSQEPEESKEVPGFKPYVPITMEKDDERLSRDKFAFKNVRGEVVMYHINLATNLPVLVEDDE